MAKKEFMWRGMDAEAVKNLDLAQFMELVPSRQRRSLKRGFTDSQKKLLKKIERGDKKIKTHCRDIIIVPAMLGNTIEVYNGKNFVPVNITLELIGGFLGEYAPSRKIVSHSAPGVGATRSSSAISVR